MSADVKKIALYLSAAGFTAKDEKASRILKEDDGNLIEQNLDGTDIIDEIFIAEDVEPDTSALYINREDRCMIAYATNSNTLGCVQRISAPEDEPEWTEVPIAGIGAVPIFEKSRIAGTNTPDGAQVFFQHPDGSIMSILYDDETKMWEEGDVIPAAAAAAGTPLYVTELEDALGVFYLSNENKICGQLQNNTTGEWKEHVIENSFFEDAVTSFILIWDGQQKAFNTYVLAAATLVHIDCSGGRKVLGKWASGQFVPDTAAECGLFINIWFGLFGVCGNIGGYRHRCKRHRRHPRRC
ncbi:hypothetical protein DIS24_g9893 [Lasiodiplodia hormozganensis]|uniref:Fucose-specific lectin n=1 Tax=Lasiodiplodia hormozganensis TaxID=869390 RepID=A0AA40CH80_9PEZI|nr:hypothetical protein DIS24_g9893 [Lasiodiplodia hormozganensis]